MAKAEELLSQATDQRELGVNPETGRAVLVKNGRYGPYVTEEADDGEKPRTASLFKSMSPETVTLEDVLPLLALPAHRRRRSRDRRGGRSSRTAATARS